ncbi:MAG: 4-(cytidine 5'-diphospho)-2-C-methyl-D-erythritol kinase [Desulfobacterales bacterium]|nr:4-(cytidine 5'-diphospho)-2-C-methyl-D-erythritol kinase [Desulfobacterales bacterium]
MEIKSFAKVNLYLEITGKRPDGYHELITVMCLIDLHDTLRIEFQPPVTRLSCNHADVPSDEANLVLKAARTFFQAIGRTDALTVSIDKKIPVGAGLGGGSSNAAAMLTALNNHYQQPLDKAALMTLAGRIGADVPFFIYGRPALAMGIGEDLTPFDNLSESPVVLIYPGKPLSTGEVYQRLNFGLTKSKKINTQIIFRHIRKKEIPALLHNDLEPPAFAMNPEIAHAKTVLLGEGAAGALMSGSGSSVFGIYPNPEDAHKACADIKAGYAHWDVFLTKLRTG